MGNNTSKSSKNARTQGNSSKPKVEDLVDLGAVFPNGLYPSTEQDYDTRKLRTLIIARKIAPFYKGLAEAPEPIVVPTTSNSSSLSLPSPLQHSTSSKSLGTPDKSPKIIGRPRSSSTTKKDTSYDPYLERKKAYIEKMKQREKMLYNDAVECPICFLYYPANINYSRCCDQPICTECFVQIHRPIETPDTPATCPFCIEENYGVLYEAPSWSEKFQARSRSGSHSTISGTRHTTSGTAESCGPRRESVSHNNPDVVLVDHIRPNWDKAKTVTATTPVRPLSRRNSASAGNRPRNNLLRAAGVSSLLTRPGRSASSAAATNPANIRNGNDMDIEDWMLMEAIRLSLAEQEESERKEALKRSKEAAEEGSTTNTGANTNTEERQSTIENDSNNEQHFDTHSTSV